MSKVIRTRLIKNSEEEYENASNGFIYTFLSCKEIEVGNPRQSHFLLTNDDIIQDLLYICEPENVEVLVISHAKINNLNLELFINLKTLDLFCCEIVNFSDLQLKLISLSNMINLEKYLLINCDKYLSNCQISKKIFTMLKNSENQIEFCGCEIDSSIEGYEEFVKHNYVLNNLTFQHCKLFKKKFFYEVEENFEELDDITID